MSFTLVTGGIRSGKSHWAEERARELAGTDVLYLATAQPGDPEMAERIRAHRERRPGGWRTVEVPVRLPEAIREQGREVGGVLVDCLTLWVSNLVTGGAEGRPPLGDEELDGRFEDLLAALDRSCTPTILVTNEVGLGGIPGTPIGRRYADALGRLNLQMARRASEVVLMVAGHPLKLGSN